MRKDSRSFEDVRRKNILSKQSRRKIMVKKNILANLKRARLSTCAVCSRDFEENETIFANSIRKRYCMDCAIKVNIFEN